MMKPILNYALNDNKNDKNAITPIHIDLKSANSTEIYQRHFKHITPIHKNDKVRRWNKYTLEDIERLTLMFPNDVYEGYPWESVELINMDNNLCNNEIIQDQKSIVHNIWLTNMVCYLVFEYLKFFDFAVVERISSHFKEPICRHLTRKYAVQKVELFKNFNLYKFIMGIDGDSFYQSVNTITIYELRFIFKHFGLLMESVEIQTKFLKKNRGDPVTMDEFKIIVAIIQEMVLEWVKPGNIQSFKIDDILLNNIFIDLTILYKPQFEELLQKNVNIKELTILTDNLMIDRSKMIELLKKVKTEKIIIKRWNYKMNHENRNCDVMIDALMVNSLYSLEFIHVKSCQSERFFQLLNYFINLKEIVIDDLIICNNFSNYWLDNLNLSKLEKLTILNFNFVDDYLCFEFIKRNKSIKILNISNCDNITGIFINDFNTKLEQGSIIIDTALHIDLTNMKSKFIYSKEGFKDINDKLVLSSNKFATYSDNIIKRELKLLENDINTEQIDFYDRTGSNLLPITFLEVLRKYFSSHHLNLENYYQLNENCLNFLSSYCFTYEITLNTFYPKVCNEKIFEILKKFQINSVTIYGVNKIINIDNNSNYILKQFILSSANTLSYIQICDCLVDEHFIRTLNYYKNLKKISLVNVSILFQQEFLQLRLSNLENMEIQKCKDLSDEMCLHIIQNCPSLEVLTIFKCKNLMGTFLEKIKNRMTPLFIQLDETPASFKYFKGVNETEITDTNSYIIVCSFRDTFQLFKSLYNQSLSKDINNKLIDRMRDLDLTNCDNQDLFIFNNIYFRKLYQMELLSKLKLSSFYQNVTILRDLYTLNISELELSNDKIHEKDLTTDILINFAKYNSTHLKIIKLTKCKINEQTIISINQLRILNVLSFESVEGFDKNLIEKLLVYKLEDLYIIDNDHVDDALCMNIIETNPNLKILGLPKCKMLTKLLLPTINEISVAQILTIDVSCTLAGYYHLFNMKSYGFRVKYMHYAANKYYLSKILLELELNTITRIPHDIMMLDTALDLTEYTELDDLSFYLVSQLIMVPILSINAFYKHVFDIDNIIFCLLQMNFTQLTIKGNFNTSPVSMNSNCDYIIRGLSESPKRIQLITIVNCIISTDLINLLSNFKYLEVINIWNENINYIKKIIEEFKFSKSSIYFLYVNNEKIVNNYNDINTLKRKLQLK